MRSARTASDRPGSRPAQSRHLRPTIPPGPRAGWAEQGEAARGRGHSAQRPTPRTTRPARHHRNRVRDPRARAGRERESKELTLSHFPQVKVEDIVLCRGKQISHNLWHSNICNIQSVKHDLFFGQSLKCASFPYSLPNVNHFQ